MQATALVCLNTFHVSPVFLVSSTDMKIHATLRQAQRAIGAGDRLTFIQSRFPEYVLRRTRSTPCSAPAFASDPLWAGPHKGPGRRKWRLT